MMEVRQYLDHHGVNNAPETSAAFASKYHVAEVDPAQQNSRSQAISILISRSFHATMKVRMIDPERPDPQNLDTGESPLLSSHSPSGAPSISPSAESSLGEPTAVNLTISIGAAALEGGPAMTQMATEPVAPPAASNGRGKKHRSEPDWTKLERQYGSDQVRMMKAVRKRGWRAVRVYESAEGTPISPERARRLRPAP
jgi:hypothetical protein